MVLKLLLNERSWKIHYNLLLVKTYAMKILVYWEKCEGTFGKNFIFWFTIIPEMYLVEVRVCEWSWNQFQKRYHEIFTIFFLGHFIVWNFQWYEDIEVTHIIFLEFDLKNWTQGMLYKFSLRKREKINECWESYHKFHLEHKILVRPMELHKRHTKLLQDKISYSKCHKLSDILSQTSTIHIVSKLRFQRYTTYKWYAFWLEYPIFWVIEICDKYEYYYCFLIFLQRKIQKLLHQLNLQKDHSWLINK